MQQTLQAHIIYLEQHIQTLTKRIRKFRLTEEERSQLQSEILIAEEALAHYRKAFELEQRLA